MTVDTLHDALTLLPADLVAQTDERRCRKSRRVHWQRWAAMAACLVLILGAVCCSGAGCSGWEKHPPMRSERKALWRTRRRRLPGRSRRL